MKNKNFYNVVDKTKLLKVFENNKVMYETYFGVKKPEPGPGPEPVSPFIFNALPYDVGRVTTPMTYNDYITIEAIKSTFNINTKDPAYSFEGKNYDKVFRLTGGNALVTVVINRGEYTHLDVIAATGISRLIYVNGVETGAIAAQVGPVVNSIDISQLGDVINLTVSGGTDLIELRLYKE